VRGSEEWRVLELISLWVKQADQWDGESVKRVLELISLGVKQADQ
jgi:hypothetical protein